MERKFDIRGIHHFRVHHCCGIYLPAQLVHLLPFGRICRGRVCRVVHVIFGKEKEPVAHYHNLHKIFFWRMASKNKGEYRVVVSDFISEIGNFHTT